MTLIMTLKGMTSPRAILWKINRELLNTDVWGCEEEKKIEERSCSEKEIPDSSNIIKAKRTFQEREQVTD